MTARRGPLLGGGLVVALAACGTPGQAPAPPQPAPVVAAPAVRTSPGLAAARAQHRLGLDRRRLGRLEEARQALMQARDLAARYGDAAERAEVLNDLGDVLFQLGDLEGQEQTEWQALELAESSGLATAAATAWNNLGVGFAARGRPSAALNAQLRSRELWRGLGNLPGEATALHNQGVQLLQLGRVGEGMEALRQAISRHRRLGHTTALGQSLASLAWGLALDGQTDAALATYDEALAALTATGAAFDLAVALEQRAQLDHRLGRLREAREDLGRSLALAGTQGGASRFHTAYLHLGLGAVLRGQGQAAEALPLLRSSVAEFDELGGQEGRVLARLELARALRAVGARTEAAAVLETAVATVESARANLHLASLRGTYLGGWQEIYQELVDLLAEAALEAPTRGEHERWAARAFAVTERARARALLDLLAAPFSAEGLAAPGWEERIGRLRRRIEQLEAEAMAHGGDPQEGDSDLAHRRGAVLRRLRFELEVLQESATTVSGLRPQAAQPAALSDLVAQLDGKTTLLAYSLGPERSWLWRIDSGGVEVRPLAAGPRIEAAARNLHQLLPLGARIGFRKAADSARRYLSGLVLAPLGHVPLGDRIALVPDGDLHLIPFAALDLPPGNDGAARALGEDHEVVHLPSASALIELRRRRESRVPALRPLAILADPVFEADDARFGTRPRPPGAPAGEPAQALARTRQAFGGRFGRLFGSADEARRIAAIAGLVPGQPPVQVISGFAATREQVTGGSLDGFHILHFASHALIDADDPALSGLVLSLYGPDGRPRDGLLRSRDLYGRRLSADLVVLSACQTALGQRIRGEGVTGLAEGFFAAGASQLVVSLWEVDDRATAELMSRFYAHLLLRGRSASNALRLAQRELRDETEWNSPAYWAAFIAVGDWQPRAALSPLPSAAHPLAQLR